MKSLLNKRIILFVVLILLLLFSFSVSNAQKQLNIAVLPFLIQSDSDIEGLDSNYGYNLSKLIGTKLYYSTTTNILSMKQVKDIMNDYDMEDLSNIKEPYLYLVASSEDIDYVLIPRLKIQYDDYYIEGSLYDVDKRLFIKSTSIENKADFEYIYNDIDVFTEDIFSNILRFSEFQHILKPEKINNLDILFYFDLDNSQFEYSQFKSKFNELIKYFNNIGLGDNLRVAVVYSKSIKSVKKYIIKNFNSIENREIKDLILIDKNNVDDFVASPHLSLVSSIKHLEWSSRKNNQRYLFCFTKNKIEGDINSFTQLLNKNKISCNYFILENTDRNTIELNQNLSKMCNGISLPLSYIFTIPVEHSYGKRYILQNNSLYKVKGKHNNTEGYDVNINNMKSYKNILEKDNLELISYDLFVNNIKNAIKFFTERSKDTEVSLNDESLHIRDIEVITNIDFIIGKALNKLYRKHFDMFNYILVYNESIPKKISLPLFAPNLLVSNYKEGDEIILGAKVLHTNTASNFELDPFTLIFAQNYDYIPEELLVKDFVQVSKNPDYYSKNGILNNNIWFFKVKLIELGN